MNAENNTSKIEHTGFSCLFGDNGAFSVEHGGRTLIRNTGVNIGRNGEADAIPRKSRLHELIDMDAWRHEFEAIIPFGNEPKIARGIEIFGRLANITTDLKIRKKAVVEALGIDQITLPGKWISAAVLTQEDFMSGKIDLSQKPLGDNETIFESEQCFVTVILTADTGERVEIGAGDDLWRWNAAAKLDLRSNFSIKQAPDEIIIRRQALIWPENSGPEQTRPWRFTWYCAWDDGKKTAAPDNTIPPPAPKGGWPEKSQAMIDGKHSGNPCFCSPAVTRHLRHWLRANPPTPNENIAVSGFSPSCCDSASHCDRPRKKVLTHWDMTAIFEFHFWANRMLRHQNSKMASFAAADSPFADTPAVNSLGLP